MVSWRGMGWLPIPSTPERLLWPMSLCVANLLRIYAPFDGVSSDAREEKTEDPSRREDRPRTPLGPRGRPRPAARPGWPRRPALAVRLRPPLGANHVPRSPAGVYSFLIPVVSIYCRI